MAVQDPTAAANRQYGHSLPQPYSSAGTSAVTGLSSTILNLLFPLHIPWFKLQFDNDELIALTEQSAQANAGQAIIEKRMLNRMLQDQLHPVMLEAMYRIVIEGQVLIHKLPNKRGLRYIPLRSFIVKRFNGQVTYLCIKEDLPTKDGKEKCLYTMVDYQEGEVYQQDSDRKEAKKINADPGDYIVATTTIPAMQNYADGFALRYFGTIHYLNQGEHDMLRAVNIAAKAILFINPESGFTATDVQRLQTGQAVMGPPGGRVEDSFQWFSAQMKLSEWTWVYQALEVKKQELSKNFALGLTQQQGLNTDRQTAESVRRIAQELDATVGAHAQVLQTTLQLPLAKAYLKEQMSGAPELFEKTKPIVTSGNSAMSRLSELQSLFQLIGMFMTDPNFAAQIDTIALFRHAADIIGVPTQDFIKQAPQGPAMGGQSA